MSDSQDRNIIDEAILNLQDGQHLVLQFAEGLEMAIMTRTTLDEMEREMESDRGEIEYLSCELSLMYDAYRNGTPIKFNNEDGRVDTKAVIDYMIERSKDDIKPS